MQIEDPDARQRSLMLQQKSLCNGEKTGYECEFYWFQVSKLESNAPDFLKLGEKQRACLREGTALPMLDTELAVYCNQYKPTVRPYNTEFEEYNPLTKAEYKQLITDTPLNKDIVAKTVLSEEDAKPVSANDLAEAFSGFTPPEESENE